MDEPAPGATKDRAAGPEAEDARLLALILRLGEALLSAGAETERVEDTAVRVAAAYGHGGVEAFAVPTGLFLSIDRGRTTGRRRVTSRGMDLGRLVALNDLARRLSPEHPPMAEAEAWLGAPDRQASPYPVWAAPILAGAGNAAFTYLIGGRPSEAGLAFVAGLVVQAAVRGVGPSFARRFFHSAGGGFVAVFVAAAWAASAPVGHLGQTLPVFLGGAAVAAVAEVSAGRLRVPVLTVLAPGNIPLTPGLLAYHSILGLATGNYAEAVHDGVLTLFWAGSLAVGIAAVALRARALREHPRRHQPVA